MPDLTRSESRPQVSKRAPRSVQGGESQHSHARGLFPKSSSSDRQTDSLPQNTKTAAAQERDWGSAVRGAQAAAAPSPSRRDEVYRTLRGFATRLQLPLGQATPGSAFTAARSQRTERICFCCFFMNRSTANTGSSVLKNLQSKSEQTTKLRKSRAARRRKHLNFYYISFTNNAKVQRQKPSHKKEKAEKNVHAVELLFHVISQVANT